MRHLILTIVAIAVAGIAAVAATTAMLNAPVRIGPATSSANGPGSALADQAPASSKEIPDAPPPKNAEPPTKGPAEAAKGGAEPAAGQAPPADGETPETPDSDPYEGIAPEELPPDLQYDADASVSFPTNI